jgi:hypothetical protein
MNSRLLSFLFLVFIFNSCIERYFLESQSESEARLVVDAHINNYDSIQCIRLSLTAALDQPSFFPFSGCEVYVSDQDNRKYNFNESTDQPGYYYYNTTFGNFKLNENYRLEIITPEGILYESGNEVMSACPVIDEIKYELRSTPTSDPKEFVDGLQFYVDLIAGEGFNRFYRWEIIETWEYHSSFPIKDYIDTNNVYINGPSDYSKYICYKNAKVRQLFVASTKGFSTNNYENFELHFVDNLTQKLAYKYSILLKQIAITEEAYYYWNALVKNQQESGGLFETQPVNVPGNIKCVSDSTKEIIGFFSISDVKTKRISIFEVPGLELKYKLCDPIPIDGPIPRDIRPFYFVNYQDAEGEMSPGTSNSDCFDCTLHGGSTELPEFWRELDE